MIERNLDRLLVEVEHLRGESARGHAQPDDRLQEELGLDSLALAELVAWLRPEGGYMQVSQRLAIRGWANLTVRELLEISGAETAEREDREFRVRLRMPPTGA